MPGRATVLASGHYYHIFNRGLDRRVTFSGRREYQRAILSLNFYRYQSPPNRLSEFLSLSSENQAFVLEKLVQKESLIQLIAFCLMPNHFHLLIKQLIDGGISKFMSNFQNSYTRYFNTKHKRKGSLFEDQFKAVMVETNEQLVHLSRYIHLNPYTSYIIKDVDGLIEYPWSSFREYLELEKGICSKEIVLGEFKGKEEYKRFVLNQKDYQRRLDQIKHLSFEEQDTYKPFFPR